MRHMTYSHRLMIVVVLIINTGCGKTTSVSTSTALAPPFTQHLSEGGDLSGNPTATAYTSFTHLPTVPPNSTQTAIAQLAISARSTEQSLLASFPHICKNDYSSRKNSPNGLWLVELCYSENDHDLVMTVSNSKTQVLWKLLYQDYLPEMDFVPDGGMLVVHWSNDRQYAYFTAFVGGDGGECFYGNQLETGTGLFRLDLQTGRTTAILPPSDRYFWYSFSVSPTDRRLVYGVHSLDLKLLDITTGQLIEVAHNTDFSDGGGYIWSPDGLAFVYSTVTYNSDHVGREGYSVRLVDAQSGSERILLESPDTCFAAMSWTEDSIVMIEKNFGEALIEFDLNSNKVVSESTITP